VVELGGDVYAESGRALELSEGSLPLRRYLPREDVRMDLLEPSDHRTTCPFKGTASYFSAPGHENIAWSYEDPLPEREDIRGLIAFYDERAQIRVDE
jgi:uncharacterized protein (DUF427 family)